MLNTDPRGPERTIVAVGDKVETNHHVTTSCGHTYERVSHFHYKVGTTIRCFMCADKSDPEKPL